MNRANGQSLKCLTVIDEFTREALAIDVAGSIRSGRVIEALPTDQRTWRTTLSALPQSPRGEVIIETWGRHYNAPLEHHLQLARSRYESLYVTYHRTHRRMIS
jgi:hypothetical protein